jgi:protease-4
MKKKIIVGFILAFLMVMGALSIKAVRNPDYGLSGNGSPCIGVIEIKGVIAGDNAPNWLGGQTSGSRGIMDALRKAQKREDIKAVILRIDSPGGTSVASEEIGIEVDKLQKQGKLVITSMGDVCASGGYWIACSSNHIVANGSTLTGSIGVIMNLANLEGLYDKLGIKQEAIKSGQYKDMGSHFCRLEYMIWMPDTCSYNLGSNIREIENRQYIPQ